MKIPTCVLYFRLGKIPLLYPVWLSFLLMALAWVLPVQAGPVQAGFKDTVVFSGLTAPTDVQFASDGRV